MESRCFLLYYVSAIPSGACGFLFSFTICNLTLPGLFKLVMVLRWVAILHELRFICCCSGLRWLRWWTLGSCLLYSSKDIMQLVEKELHSVESFQRYAGHGHLSIILCFYGVLTNGELFHLCFDLLIYGTAHLFLWTLTSCLFNI